MSFISTMFIFNLFITIGKWYKPKYEDIGWFCHFIAFVVQYSEMSAFLWLSALSHNVWNSFRKLKPAKQNLGKRSRLGIFDKKYKWYALYAWGCPFIVTFVTVIMQYLPEEFTKDYLTPGIGIKSCSLHELKDTWEKLFYLHIINGPILVRWLRHTLEPFIFVNVVSHITDLKCRILSWIHMEYMLWSFCQRIICTT